MRVLDRQEPAWAEDDWTTFAVGLHRLSGRVRAVAALPGPETGDAPPPAPELLDFLLGAVHLADRLHDLLEAAAAEGEAAAAEGEAAVAREEPPPVAPPATEPAKLLR